MGFLINIVLGGWRGQARYRVYTKACKLIQGIKRVTKFQTEITLVGNIQPIATKHGCKPGTLHGTASASGNLVFPK